jgi:hypothetical protein
MRIGFLGCAVVAWAGTFRPAPASEALHGNVVLVLDKGLATGDKTWVELELEWPVREGMWPEAGWGYAVDFSRGFHWPRILKNEGGDKDRALSVEVRIGPDMWTPGGWARYEIQVARDGDRFSGTFTGSFVKGGVPWPGGKENPLPPALRDAPPPPDPAPPRDYGQGLKTSGAVSGRLDEPWPGAKRAGHRRPEPGEHPRLPFRKSDLPMIRLLLNMRSETLGGSWHTRAGIQCGIELGAYGKDWLFGSFLPQVAGVPGANTDLGGRTVSWRRAPERACVIDFDLTPAFYGNPPRDLPLGETLAGFAAKQGASLVRVPGWRTLFDYGVRAYRSMAIDVSGLSGAPLLVAVVDRVDVAERWRSKWLDARRVGADEAAFLKAVGLEKRPALPSSVQRTLCRWRFPVPMGERYGSEMKYAPGRVTVEGSRFGVAAKSGALAGVVAGNAIDSRLATDHDGRYFVVFTLQEKDAPAFAVEGEGPSARVRVGKRVVRFENGTVVLE